MFGFNHNNGILDSLITEFTIYSAYCQFKNNLSDKVYLGSPVYDEYSRQLKYKNSDVLIMPSKNENFGLKKH